jgi:hypothetical protein
MTRPDPSAEAAQRRPALLLASLLLAAGLLVGVSVTVGIASAADSSPVSTSVLAALTAALPGVLALVLALRRPLLGLAATAGGGVVGVVRLLADLAVVTETDRISRPELFAETTDRARPLAAGGGAWLLLAADVLMLVVGVVAATRVAALTSAPPEPASSELFGPPDGTGVDRGVPSESGGVSESAVAEALSGQPPGRRALNLPMVGVGFLGALLLLVGGLGTPYSGGYLALRILPFGSSLTGLVAAVLLAFLAAVVVVIAAELPRAVAQALLCGTALAAAVPSLTAVVAVLGGAPTELSSVVWWGLAGAAILAASGLLVRGAGPAAPPTDTGGAPPDRRLTWGTGVLALVAAGALAGASRLPLLYLDGAPPDPLAGSVLDPAGPPFLVAAVPLAVAAVLSLVPPIAAAGRAAVGVLWAGAVYALGQALWVSSLVQTSASGSSSGFVHSWTPGPGQWLAVVGTVGAMVAAALAVITSRREADAATDIVDDASSSASRTARRWPAAALTVLILLSLALPVHSEPGTGAAASLLHGYDLDTWGFWALAVGAVAAVWAAATTRLPSVAAALPVAAACLVLQPLLVPAVVRASPGFVWGWGLISGLLTAAALLAAAVVFALLARRVQVVVITPLTVDPPGRGSARAATPSASRAAEGG